MAAVLESERVVSEPTRLAILIRLATDGAQTFNELKLALELSDGNLSVHARKLADAGLVIHTKGYRERESGALIHNTYYTLTTDGRKELWLYLDKMSALVRMVSSRT